MADKETEPVISDNEDAASQHQERFNQQCYLMDHWRTYCNKKNNPGGFRHFTCIDAPPTELIQKLTSGLGRQEFMNITTGQTSLLTPKIKLFKVLLKPDGKPISGLGQEIIFRTHYDEATISDITSNKTIRGDAVGLKELTYELYDAGSKEMAGRRQNVTIKFFAESLAALAKKAPNGAAPLELAIASSKYTEDTKGNLVPNSERYAMKLVYGWAIPKENQEFIPKGVKMALEASVQTLMLTLKDHSISWNENGSVELELEYEGYIDTKLDEVQRNILWPDPKVKAKLQEAELKAAQAGKKEEEAKKEQEEAGKEQAKEEAAGGSSGFFSSSTQKEDALKKSEDGLEKAAEEKKASDEELANLRAVDKTAKYRRLLSELEKFNKIWYVDVDAAQIGLMQEGGRISDREVRMDMSKTRVAAKSQEEIDKMSPEEKEKYQKDLAKSSEAQENEKAAPPQRGGSATALQGGSEAIQKAGQEKESADKEEELEKFSKANKTQKGKEENKVRINYMYFGDILSVVLSVSYSGKQLPIRYLLGSLSFTDPRTGRKERINIADIPVSLNLFTEFWIKNVVSQTREIYTIKQFIQASVKELIVAALGDGCYDGAGNTTTSVNNVSFTTFGAQTKQGGSDPLGPKSTKRISEAHLNNLAPFPNSTSDVKGSPQFAKPTDHYEYLFVYCASWSSRELRENKQEDNARGIYHIAVGQDRGPVKKIAFEKSDIPYQRTAALAGGSSTYSRLAAAYKAGVSMIGNTLFMPGNYVYIAPTSMGLSRSTASELGLGGYYVIGKLSGKVDSSGWTCDVGCRPIGPTGKKAGSTTSPAPTSPEAALAAAGVNPEKKS